MSDKYNVPNKLPAKQVSILAQRRKRIIEEKSHGHVKRLNRAFKLRKKIEKFRKAETFVKEYRNIERDQKRMYRSIIRQQVFKKVPKPEKKLLVVMRHRSQKVASPVIYQILESIKLGRCLNATFLENNAESMALLRLVEPYVTWGYPTINTLRDLIFKHGFFFVQNKKTHINSNQLIEENLGDIGIICIEDMIHEIFTASKNLKKIHGMMLPFKLNAPLNGWKKKIAVSFAKGGEYGDRGEQINALFKRCM